MVHISGVKNTAADAMSRHPTGNTNPEALPIPDDMANVNTTAFTLFGHPFLTGIRSTEPDMESAPPTMNVQQLPSAASLNTMAITWDRVKVATASDNNMEKLRSVVETGFPQPRHQLPPELQEYHQFHEHLHTVDGVIL